MSQKIIFLEGDNIFTSTKQEKIFGQNSPIKASKYIFAMGLCNEIKKDELEKVKALLSAHEITFAPNLIITPRLGTQSSWSSKAQDIFKNVGIKSVQRLERFKAFDVKDKEKVLIKSFDKMTESHFSSLSDTKKIFQEAQRKKLITYAIHEDSTLLDKLNNDLGLALNDVEKAYLNKLFQKLNRSVSDAELMMFSQSTLNTVGIKFFVQNGKLIFLSVMIRFSTLLSRLLKKIWNIFFLHITTIQL